MLVRLDAGEGHAPEEARKAGQKPILSTGCRYADDVLIPVLAKHSRFIDQELLSDQPGCNNEISLLAQINRPKHGKSTG